MIVRVQVFPVMAHDVLRDPPVEGFSFLMPGVFGEGFRGGHETLRFKGALSLPLLAKTPDWHSFGSGSAKSDFLINMIMKSPEFACIQ